VKLLLSLLASTIFLSGCATGATRNGMGILFTDTKDAIAVTSNVAATKRGEACATNILSLVSTGDMSISAAMKAGGIVKASSADYSQFSVLGIFSKTCTIVVGE
jgi:uncharacterized cupredoxin-like copper-binding protein